MASCKTHSGILFVCLNYLLTCLKIQDNVLCTVTFTSSLYFRYSFIKNHILNRKLEELQ